MRPRVGLLNSVPSPLLCEMYGASGFDFVVLDMEHTLMSPDELQHAIRACEVAGCDPWVRVPEVDEKLIGRVLDAGARGVVIARLETVSQARRAVQAAHYPPIGSRGITGGRITRSGGTPLAAHIEQSREQIRVAVMIESEAGVTALPQIVAVPGVSLVMEGALDLALDLGLGPQPLHPQVWDRLLKIADGCDAAGVPFCPNPRTTAQREHWLSRGVRCLLAGEDRGLLLAALRERRALFDTTNLSP